MVNFADDSDSMTDYPQDDVPANGVLCWVFFALFIFICIFLLYFIVFFRAV